MIAIKKASQKPVAIIRAATGAELINYEKHKAIKNADTTVSIEDFSLPIVNEVRINPNEFIFKPILAAKDSNNFLFCKSKN